MDKISTTKKNILKYIESQGITKKDFFQSIGISESNFKGKGLHSEIGSDKLVKILTAYPDINVEWLLTGEGNMLKNINNDYKDGEMSSDLLKEPESFLKKRIRFLEISNELMSQEIERLRKK